MTVIIPVVQFKETDCPIVFSHRKINLIQNGGFLYIKGTRKKNETDLPIR